MPARREHLDPSEIEMLPGRDQAARAIEHVPPVPDDGGVQIGSEAGDRVSCQADRFVRKRKRAGCFQKGIDRARFGSTDQEHASCSALSGGGNNQRRL
jgi:hypothetical protein